MWLLERFLISQNKQYSISCPASASCTTCTAGSGGKVQLPSGAAAGHPAEARGWPRPGAALAAGVETPRGPGSRPPGMEISLEVIEHNFHQSSTKAAVDEILFIAFLCLPFKFYRPSSSQYFVFEFGIYFCCDLCLWLVNRNSVSQLSQSQAEVAASSDTK